MNDRDGLTARSLLVWLAAGVVTVLATAWLLPDVHAGARVLGHGGSFVTLIVGLCAAALVACLAWAWVVTSVVLVGAARGVACVPGVPAWARRAVLGACGLALVGGTAPAMAGVDVPALHETRRDVHPSLAGLPLPDRALGAARPLAVRERDDVIVVRSGDTLWDLAAARLSPDADAARIAAATAVLYRANRAVVGADPDLILPGQHLRVPPTPGISDR